MKTLLKPLLEKVIADWQRNGKIPADLNIPIQIERTRDSKFGDFSSNIALLLAKPCQQKPMDIAQALVQEIEQSIAVEKITIAAPGFINIQMTESAYHSVIQEIMHEAQHYGRLSIGQHQRIHVEFISSNPTGPLHVGHGRHAAFGASLCNILEMAGYQVDREYYVNDAGRQMRILAVSIWMRYLSLFDPAIAFPRRGYQGDYVTQMAHILKEQHKDHFLHPTFSIMAELPDDNADNEESYVDGLIERAELLLGKLGFHEIFTLGLNTILADMKQDLAEFGVQFDQWFHESELLNDGALTRGIQLLQTGGFLYQKDGATWFKATDFGDEKDRVVIRENGQPTYFASDVAYHLNKFERGYDQMLDIFGSDHHGYIPRINAFIQALGKDVKKLHVLLVQFAILYRGNIRASMSTRGGDFVTLRQLRQEVGNDVARFFYIMRKREQHLDFDLELAKSQSNDNPVYYIQYAHARICSVFRQLEQKKWVWDLADAERCLACLNSSHEKSVMRCLSRYPEVIELAAQIYEPSVMANYLQELAHEFHAYYNATIFLVPEAEIRNPRLYLISAIRQVLANGLKLVGVSAPEMM